MCVGAAASVAPCTHASQPQIRLNEVEVSASRPLSRIGITSAAVDSSALHATAALSMAEVLERNAPVFVKTTGRATDSTVSIRGAAASHTAVYWNGLELNPPLSGAADFSLLPAMFVDRASVFYGGSSLALGSGGLGGGISLETAAKASREGFSGEFIQGIGSYATFDEYFGATWKGERLTVTAKFYAQSSRNDFRFLNRDKKLNVYDENHNIVAQYNPVERNVNGRYADIHFLSAVNYRFSPRSIIDASVWWTDSDRELPITTVDYSQNRSYENRIRENTVRANLNWTRLAERSRIGVSLAGSRTWNAYTYGLDTGDASINLINNAHSHSDVLQLSISDDLYLGDCMSAEFSVNDNFTRVDSRDHASLIQSESINRSRNLTGLHASIRWTPSKRVGLAADVRTQVIVYPSSHKKPSLNSPSARLSADWNMSRYLSLRGSATHNVKTPSVGDLWIVPGGNPDLRPERSLSGDLGATFEKGIFKADFSGYFSRVDDWIEWLPTPKGYFTPRNLRRVYCYGTELTVKLDFPTWRGVKTGIRGGWSWTRAENRSVQSTADRSLGRQLPYTPLHSLNWRAKAQWKGWELAFDGVFHSRRFTMTSNDPSPTGSVAPYSVANMVLGREFALKNIVLTFKAAVNNIFDADYITVLSHPMPGINFEIFAGFRF